MQSYFSTYFSSGNQSAHGTPPQSSSGTSTWSNTLSSRLQGLRKALTTNSEQDDPDNEDASHVSNVLRGYYTEMGRPFPSWLPPDPKKPAVALPPQQSSQYGQFGNTYGGYGANQYGNTQQPVSRNSGGRGGGLSDLWDSGSAQPAAAQVPSSLRTRPERPVPQSLLQSQNSARSLESHTPPQSQSQSSQSTTRLLPSQRAGSYQSAVQNTSAAGAAGAGSRDRLRARLQAGGSGRNSPAPSASGGSYGQSAYTADSAYSGGGSGGSPSPFVSASQPWVGGDDEFNGSYGGGGSDDTGYHNPRSGASGLARGQRPGGPR